MRFCGGCTGNKRSFMWGGVARRFYDVILMEKCKNHMGIVIWDFWRGRFGLLYCGILVHMGIVT